MKTLHCQKKPNEECNGKISWDVHEVFDDKKLLNSLKIDRNPRTLIHWKSFQIYFNF